MAARAPGGRSGVDGEHHGRLQHERAHIVADHLDTRAVHDFARHFYQRTRTADEWPEDGTEPDRAQR
ncbi:MAG: hypothetical protein ACRDWW_02315, partial [Acidimicrobiales bacterium]